MTVRQHLALGHLSVPQTSLVHSRNLSCTAAQTQGQLLRKRSYPESPYGGSPTGSEKSSKRGFNPSPSAKSDKFVWKNAFDPIPVVEELGTAGDTSPESPKDLLEFNIIINPASPIDAEDEVSSESYSSTPPSSDEN
ncbi:hypothetical protein FPOAC2_00508 [Fusarium poae]